MDKTKWVQIALTASLLIMTSAMPTQATVLRAFVSSTGNDANAGANCPQTTPCKTFAGAFPVVTAGGELIALDTSGYGPLTNINKAITVAAVPGATAYVIVATGSSGFTINGAASDLITLRNLSFNGTGAASTNGVLHNSGKLVIKNCEFTQLTAGLRVIAGTVVAGNSTFIGNTGRGVHASGTGKVQLLDCTIANNATGITADGVGGCPLNFPVLAPVVFVRLDGGSVVNNTLGFEMLNTGLICGSVPPLINANGQNIFVRIIGTSSDLAKPSDRITVNIIGNTSTLFVSPLGAPSGFSNALGIYGSTVSELVP